MNFSEFLSRLSEDYPVPDSHIAENADIFHVQELPGPHPEPKAPVQNVLYFADTDTCDEAAFSGLSENGLNLVWTGGRKPSVCENAFVNWAQIETGEPGAILQCIRDILVESCQAQALYISLLQALLSGQNISNVLSDIAEKAESTLVIIDMSGKLLANSVPVRLQNSLWLESVEQGFCPPDFIEHIRDIRRSSGFSNQQGPQIHRCEDEDLYYLLSRIIVDNALFGYVFMIQESPNFASQYRKFLPLIGRIVADSALRSQDSLTLRSRLQDNTLTDILDGIPAEQAGARIHTSGIHFPDHMCVMVVRPLYYHGKTYLKSTLLPMLTRIFPTSLYVLYHHNAVVILPQDTALTLTEELSRFQEACGRERLLAGISNPFTNPARLREYYLQAAKACSLSQQMDVKGYIHYYKDLAFYDMMERLSREQRLPQFCHPALAVLREYDHQKGTRLYDTLRAYTMCGFNQNIASEQLFLHRNTMNYRRQKIEDLTGLNFENPDTRFLLQYSFLIDHYLEHSLV